MGRAQSGLAQNNEELSSRNRMTQKEEHRLQSKEISVFIMGEYYLFLEHLVYFLRESWQQTKRNFSKK